ncbi:cytochrome P450 71A1-like [Selaginella moellendorffii]|nr:cytochrome P450 71A1-like [Selaginella moellendorffii]|eukprot:XP_024520383.1 cytochrome P450 71A1-like [Selaginella moellendorffii]
MEGLLQIGTAAIFLSWIAWSLFFAPRTRIYRGNLPPSPGFALPIIGHLHLLGKLPHVSFIELAERYGPCLMLKLGSYPCLLISSPEFAREALKVNDIAFSSRPSLAASRILGDNAAGILWAPYGQQWRNLRKLCSLELLTSRRIEESRPVRAAEVAAAMARAKEISKAGICVNLTSLLADLTFDIMRVCVTGSSESSRSSAGVYKRAMKESFVAGGEVHVGDYVPWLWWLDLAKVARMKRVHGEIDDIIQKEIDEHRGNSSGSDDFITATLRNDEICRTDRDRKGLISDVIGGGTDTSALTVEWAMAELINNPRSLERAQDELLQTFGKNSLVEEDRLEELEFLTAVVKETLRLHPPAPILIYETTHECQLERYTIPPKTRVFINIYGIARSEASWSDPLAFKPERFLGSGAIDVRGRDFEVLPFGSGRRGCPGIQLGFTMVMLVLANMLHGFHWSLPPGLSRLDMSEESGLTIPRAIPLELLAVPRLDARSYPV